MSPDGELSTVPFIFTVKTESLSEIATETLVNEGVSMYIKSCNNSHVTARVFFT